MYNPQNIPENELLLEIAHMYYELHMTQQQIADAVFMSRSQISRLLQKAIDQGIVEFYIHYPYKRHKELENRLSTQFHIKNVILADSNGKTGKEIEVAVSTMAANYILPLINSNSIVGLTWGRTTYDVIKKLSPLRNFVNMTAVQMAGSRAFNQNQLTDGQNLVRLMGERYGCKTKPLALPLCVENKLVRDSLMSMPAVSEVFDTAKKANLLFMSVGILENWKDFLNPQELADLKKKGAIGSFGGYFLDINGNIVETELYDRFIITDINTFKNVEHRIGIISDRHKAPALLAALRANLFTTIVIDTKVAYRMTSLINSLKME